MKFYLRSKGGLKYGWGHVLRSLTLARYLDATNMENEVLMVVEGDRAVYDFIRQHPIPCVYLALETTLADERRILEKCRPDVVVFDNIDAQSERLELYGRGGRKLVIFNDLGLDYSLGDIIICPQLIPHYPIRRPGKTYLFGSDYFIFLENICHIKARLNGRRIPPKAANVLIVMGGCMARSTLEKLAGVIEQIAQPRRQIKLVMGYDHNVDLTGYRHLAEKDVQFIPGTAKLGNLMASADLALAASGYVKYELASLGTPALLVSIVNHQDELGEYFASASGAARYLGRLGDLSTSDIAGAVEELAKSRSQRTIFSEKGRNLFDGRGLARISKAIGELVIR